MLNNRYSITPQKYLYSILVIKGTFIKTGSI
nr:MAG TPA: hypothetical protein [Caudoviricetes sp.]